MSEQVIRKGLKEFGLTERESDVYIFLAKNVVLKGGDIAKNLKVHKAQVYRILKSLENRGMVESTLEFPTRFTAVPFDKVLDLQVKAKREEADFLENTKNDLLSHWKSIRQRKIESSLERFVVIEGRSKIYSKIFQMIEEAEKEVLVVISGFTLIQTVQMEVDREVFKKAKKSNVRLRLLTQVSKENLGILEKNIEKIYAENLVNRIEGRHLNTDFRLFTRFMIKDEEEAIFFLTSHEGLSRVRREDAGVWTNSKAIIHILKIFFEELWLNAANMTEKINDMTNP